MDERYPFGFPGKPFPVRAPGARWVLGSPQMSLKFVSPFKTKLETKDSGSFTLLWGDPCHVRGPARGGKVPVIARGEEGLVDQADLGDTGLLEIYVIDVGQGDGILVRTPDDRWHMIDAGVSNESQMLRRGAPNFLRWKFKTDLRRDRAQLENVLITHADFDHYGGFVDILAGEVGGEPFPVDIAKLYHAGIGRFAAAPKLGAFVEGRVAPFPRGERGIRREGRFITELLSGKTSFRNPPRPFSEAFGEFARAAAKTAGTIQRLSAADGFLPGYEAGDLLIRVLGPIEERLEGGGSGLRVLGSDSVTVNGHSIVLRIDFHQARILLTGDLNTRSQKLLASYVPETQFAADVVKACHHGAEDIDPAFTKALQARATVISSGDNESFSHPRPLVMGASGRYGRESRGPKGELLPPLVYSTELARSVALAHAAEVRVPAPAPGKTDFAALTSSVRPEGGKFEPFSRRPISTDLIYGLVNVRTDGKHVLCATLEENGRDFDIKVFEAGVSP
jgi:beta-lactamase superfamily II metal-dependent hydrolase